MIEPKCSADQPKSWEAREGHISPFVLTAIASKLFEPLDIITLHLLGGEKLETLV